MTKDDIKDTESVSTKETEEVTSEKSTKPTAKAGKRSEKGLKESEAKQDKIEKQLLRSEDDTETEDKPKQHANPTRSKLERKSKKYRKASELVEKDKQYSLSEAIELATNSSTTKFDATVEIHVRLNVDPKQADQNIRDNLVLPEGTGKKVRVAVFADEDIAKEAKKAGADVAGGDEFLKQLDKGIIDFHILIATPNVMAKLSKYARSLGPKGLMPNPKSGTVTNDVNKAIANAKAGQVEYRVDSTGIVHLGTGKVSFGKDKLQKNIDAVIASIKSNKPASIKGGYVKTVYISTSMGPSIKVNSSELA